MTLLPKVSRLLASLTVTCLCALPVSLVAAAQAAELQGTPVPVESPVPPVVPASAAPAGEALPPLHTPEPALAPLVDMQGMSREEHAIRALEHRMEALMHEQRAEGAQFNDMVQLVPLVAIVFSIGGPLLLVGFLIAQRYRNKQLRQQNLNANIDKLLAAGRDIPVELLRGDDPLVGGDAGNRDRGIRNICLGTGLLLFLSILAGLDIGAVGFIWIALGVSQVLIWRLNQPKANLPLDSQVGQQD